MSFWTLILDRNVFDQCFQRASLRLLFTHFHPMLIFLVAFAIVWGDLNATLLVHGVCTHSMWFTTTSTVFLIKVLTWIEKGRCWRVCDKYLRVTSSRTGKLVTCSVDVKAGVLCTVGEEKTGQVAWRKRKEHVGYLLTEQHEGRNRNQSLRAWSD